MPSAFPIGRRPEGLRLDTQRDQQTIQTSSPYIQHLNVTPLPICWIRVGSGTHRQHGRQRRLRIVLLPDYATEKRERTEIARPAALLV